MSRDRNEIEGFVGTRFDDNGTTITVWSNVFGVFGPSILLEIIVETNTPPNILVPFRFNSLSFNYIFKLITNFIPNMNLI